MNQHFPKSDTLHSETQSHQPGSEEGMEQKPIYNNPDVPGYGRLNDKVAIITGGDSGIGRAVSLAYVKEGARVFAVYKEESEDAKTLAEEAKAYSGQLTFYSGDISDPTICSHIIEKTIETYGTIDILINNAAEQHPQESILDISNEQLEQTFRTNIFSMFYMVKAALPHMKRGSAIINTSSVTMYEGNPSLLDYSSTKGAITGFTRSLAANLGDQGIRVNQVAPGPIWTPLIPATFDASHVAEFGASTLYERPGQPVELAEAYVFLGWDYASSYITGETIHINGGRFRHS